jgi:CubicO group peptidase (beta-lactamase class C family)
MKVMPSVLTAICVAFTASPTRAGSGDLPRSSPEAQGISSQAILAFVEAADERQDFHSLRIVRHGHVVAEGWWSPYRASSPHSLFSLTKSFTSTAVGLAVAEGRLSVDDKVLDFFPDLAPDEPSENLKAMRVSDLLRMSTGHTSEVQSRDNPELTRAFLAHPVPYKPGTHFLYNTPASYMLSAIVQKATGSTVLEYLRPRLFEPLGIENPSWPSSAEGVTQGGYGLSIRTEDIARFGQLYLQRGVWNGKQIIPSSWVDQATASQTSNGSNPKSDWDQGYGYQFWRCRNGAYRADGAFGQFCIVMPEQDAVIAITSGVKNMQSVLDLVWDILLPAMQSAPLAADEESREKLEKKLAGLTLRPLEDTSPSERLQSVAGKIYLFPSNDQKLEKVSIEIEGTGRTVDLVVRFDGAEQKISCGRGGWKVGRSSFGLLPEQPLAACGAWTGDDVFTARICFYETPFVTTIRLRFDGEQLLYDSESNVAFGPTRRPQLAGKAEQAAGK